MNDYRDKDIERMLEDIDYLLDEFDDIVERLEVYYAGLYSCFLLNFDDLDDI